MPDGLSLNSSNGLIAGIPLHSGSFEFSDYPSWLSVKNSTISGITPNQILDTLFTLIATDGELSDTLDVMILIRTKPLTILSEDIDNAIYKNIYSDTLVATGGIAPYFWSIINESLPPGLNLDSLGIISGIPTSSGLFQFTARVQDSDRPFQLDSLSYNINVKNSLPQITSHDTISAIRSKDFAYVASAIDPEGNNVSYEFFYYPSWLSMTDSLLIGNTPITASDTSFLLIATDGDMSDSLKVKITIKEPSSVDKDEFPTHFQMSENYPNPFNSNTNIKIDLPETNSVEIFVLDINGRLVEKILVGELNAGSHILTWNASNIPSGLYFISFKTEKFDKVIKCTFLK